MGAKSPKVNMDLNSNVENVYEDPLGIMADENGPKGFIRVTLVIPELKVDVKNVGGKIANNAKISVNFGVKSVSLKCQMKNSNKTYAYCVPKIKAAIIPQQSKWEINNGSIFLLLKKKNPDEQWKLYEGGIRDTSEK